MGNDYQQENDVYLDKIRLGWALIEKEMDLINQHTILINNIKRGLIDISRIKEYDEYRYTWVNLIELFRFLKHGYGETVEEEKLKLLDHTVSTYMDLDREEPSIKELSNAVETVLLIMDNTGFHRLIRRMDTTKGLDRISKRYKLKGKDEE